MSVQSEIERLNGVKATISSAIAGKGVEVPSTAKLDDFPALIMGIPTLTNETIVVTNQIGNFLYLYYADDDGYVNVCAVKNGESKTIRKGAFSYGIAHAPIPITSAIQVTNGFKLVGNCTFSSGGGIN